MRHRVKSKRLNRNPSHLDAMLRNLATSIILYEKVKTTTPKAKMVQPIVEKLITFAKTHDRMNTMRHLNAYLKDENACKKLVNELLTRYEGKQSGFLRRTPLGFRVGDAAPMTQIEFV
ncbi:50S ribosomal protein L17 [Candidatus Peregrinibacteria bacterium]|nr:MAG: 50S ribosomal protein L17 [Candidatus Peregrinibacteria bacterium]